MNAVIHYLSHSGWAVKTANAIFIFDYYMPDAQDDRDLEDGVVNLHKLKDQRVYFFSSHSHNDHYSKQLNEAVARYPDMTFITGAFKAPFAANIVMQPRQTLTLDDLTITTGASTDEGVCFLVCSPDICLFHAGDHANWDSDAVMPSYRSEIDFIAEQRRGIDAAFLPVCYFGGEKARQLTQGAFYAIQKLNPSLVFPMHGGFHESVYQEFAVEAKAAGIPNRIICMEQEGGRYTIHDDDL
ncbi:MAG: MBL fold metallo-hydrolase [Clostridiales bacterium]|jgi:L-ascorbate metabolism protein UlaG (beta-lactamase superfamily)|nr:MBL fold metallo-hydrolase [Clostridiales bacterium]